MGGFMQPQGHVQVVVALADDRLDPQAALDRPRFCIEAVGPSHGTARWSARSRWKTASRQRPCRAGRDGHPVTVESGHDAPFRPRADHPARPASGVLCGGSDPRADGGAMALA